MIQCRCYDVPKHQVKSRLLLDVIVTQRASILELLSGEDKALLIRGDTAKKNEYSQIFIQVLSVLTLPCPGFWP